MGTRVEQDKAFIAAVISTTLLEDAIDWIAANLSPEDVFSNAQLESWAEDAGYEQKDE